MWAASRLREFMPVADLAYRLTGFKKFPPNTHIFASQHLLSTVALMLESFRERSAERIHVLGKCYSTHPDVFSYLRQRGFDVNPRSVHFDSHEAFDDGFDVSTQDVCARIRDLLEVNTNAGRCAHITMAHTIHRCYLSQQPARRQAAGGDHG